MFVQRRHVFVLSPPRCLTYTETRTGGLCGLCGILPLRVGLSTRFTETIDLEHGVCKHAMGELVGWSVVAPSVRRD